MKHLLAKSLASLTLLVSLFAFNACQKDGITIDQNAPSTEALHAGDRAPIMYGVTVWAPGKPSRLIEISTATGNVMNGLGTVVFMNTGGGNVNLDDLKGVCWVNGELFVTTGGSNPAGFNNMLVSVDPVTGQATFLSFSTVGTVSDIDFDEKTGTIFGLRSNTNTLISITNNGAWANYANLGAINNLGNGFVAKGLSMVRDNNGNDRIMVAATANSQLTTARIYSVPPVAGFATFLADINPAAELTRGHCGIGFDFSLNTMFINRTFSVPVAGLNSFAWAAPLPNPTNSAIWGGIGFAYEDLTTTLQ